LLASELTRVDSESYVESDFCFEVIDRVVLNDRYADLEGESGVVIQLAPDPRVERKKKPSSLAGDWIAEIHPNIWAGGHGLAR
jgi:hypothetical protein